MAVISRGSQVGGRLPSGPHQLTPTQVLADQRQRLIDAMVLLAARNGYSNTTVAEIIGRAKVSRKTFYAHFADRGELLLAAFDTTAPVALEEVRAVCATKAHSRQIDALMQRLCRVAREHPHTIALSTIEIAAVDPAGLERREQLMVDYGELLDQCLHPIDQQPVLPPALARALGGGTYRTIDTYLRTRRAVELTAIAPELARWIRSYNSVPVNLPIGEARPWPPASSGGLVGGRAPGTLTFSPNGYEPPRAVRSSWFIHHSDRERILDAVAQLTTTHGYAALSARSIIEHANIPKRTFLAHFKNKDEAFAATLEIGHIKGQAIVERARSSAPDWRTGVHNAIYSLVEFLASEPYFTRLAFVEAPLAGPAMMRRTHEHAGAYGRLLFDGAPQSRRPPPIVPQAIVQGLFELAFHYAAQRKVTELTSVTREATYLALAPFLTVTNVAH